MSTVQYVPFATGGGANIYPPATYVGLSILSTGVQPGLADPQLYNNATRQASMVAAAVATFISQQNLQDVLDDGNLANLVAALTLAVQNASVVKPARIVSASGAFVTAVTDYAIGLNRVAAPAVSSTTLPSTAAIGQEFVYEDLQANASAYPITIAAPGGHNIAGDANFVMNVDKQSTRFRYYGSSTWGVKA